MDATAQEAPAPPARDTAAGAVDVVVIGRNEGARLIACLASVSDRARSVVYVDSGSTDGSREAAARAGATVVELDKGQPFTAARARNAGFAALPDRRAEFVQFIDGDCILQDGWIDTARTFLERTPRAAVACGRRRELRPEASIYNRLCDWEWDTPLGRTDACGGDAMIRSSALAAAAGYHDGLVAGEEPELCRRLRDAGWEVWRLDAEMTLHDAGLHRLGQWWRRNLRAGHAFAEMATLHPGVWVNERRRLWLWGAALPAAALAGSPFSAWLPAAVAGAYAASFARSAWRFRRYGMSAAQALQSSGLILLSKFANLQGALTFHLRRWRRREARLIEYK